MSDRVAVVTGAGSGIGLAIARELVARRFTLLACSRDERELAGLAAEAGDLVPAPLGADLSTDEGVRALLDRVDKLDRAPDLLVNCAGLGSWGEHLSIEPSSVRAMLAVNVQALTTITSHVTRAMVARGRGSVLQVASTAAFQPVPMFAVYAATKHYVRAFSEALRDELEGTGVTVTVLYPGVTKTPFLDAARFPLDGALGSVGWIARRALLEPEQVAKEGIDGALRGERRVVVGALNQLQRALNVALPESATRALWRSFLQRK